MVALRKYILYSVLGLYSLTLLVPAFKSLPKIPSYSIYIYAFILLLIFLRPLTLLTKEFRISLIFLIIHLLYLILDNYRYLNERTTETQAEFFLYALFALGSWSFIKNNLDSKLSKKLTFGIISFSVLTSITTLFALYFFPDLAREAIGNDNPEEVQEILQFNVGSYPIQFFNSLLVSVTFYIYMHKKKIIWLMITILLAGVVIYAQIVSIVILMFLNFGLTFILINFKVNNNKKYLITLITLIFSFYILKNLIAEFLLFVSKSLKAFEFISPKLKEIALYLGSGEITESQNFNMYQYNIRKEKSINSFVESPLIGGKSSGGHHFWIDNLAEHGVLGTLPWLLIFLVFSKSLKRYFDDTEQIIILNSILIFIIMGLSKNILMSSMPVMLFLFIPLILYNYGKNSIR